MACAGPLLVAPVAPVSMQPTGEVLRFLLIDPRSESQGLPLERTSASIDRRAQHLTTVFVHEGFLIVVQLLTEHRQVVVIAELVGKPVQLLDQRVDRSGPRRLQKLQLMPKILRLLAQFVERGIARPLAHVCQCVTTLAVYLFDPCSNDGPSFAGELPMRGPGSR